MKKFLATILCFVYVVASSGATINFHYCMGKFIGLDVASPLTAKCSNCGMSKETRKGCCNDKHATFQLKKDQLAANINEVPSNNFVFIQHQFSASINTFSSIDNDVNKLIHSPPLIHPVPGFIRNCVFRI